MDNKKVYNKAVLVRLTEDEHKAWRKLSYLHEISMAQLLRSCVETKLKEVKKVLTNSDIVIS